MSLQFPCPCGRLLQVSADLSGKRVRCPSCSRIVWAPAEPERIPEARIVDGPHAPKPEVVSAKANDAGTPVAAIAPPVEARRSAEREGGCGVRHDCGAVGGFVFSLGSLVFGVVTLLFPLSWPVGGSVGALISCGALRRIRKGQANPASAGLARAGAAIGLGQALLGLILWAGVAAVAMKGPDGCCRKSRMHVVCPVTTPAPAPVEAPKAKDPKPAPQESETAPH